MRKHGRNVRRPQLRELERGRERRFPVSRPQLCIAVGRNCGLVLRGPGQVVLLDVLNQAAGYCLRLGVELL